MNTDIPRGLSELVNEYRALMLNSRPAPERRRALEEAILAAPIAGPREVNYKIAAGVASAGGSGVQWQRTEFGRRIDDQLAQYVEPNNPADGRGR